MHQTILNHGGYRYFWAAVVLCLGALAAYIWHDPVGVPNGGSWLGYTLGTIAALLILWLLWFGIRKRRYKSNTGSVAGWLSGHVYLGTSLILITLLHCGFQFGWNIHTYAFVLMLVVIFSGFFGVYAYLRYPTLMTQNRQNNTRTSMLQEIAEIDQACLQLADTVDKSIHDAVLQSIQRTKLGGGVWAQLTAKDASDDALSKLKKAVAGDEQASSGSETMVMMVDYLASTTSKKNENLRRLIDLLARKRTLATRVARDVQLQALMEIWLYVHVPLSLGLLAALTAHIISVFFYW
ncbi:MAG: hypothetical protein KDI51_18710 [Xanthomonadales bacterium]|nr:hypothetical protein [Xanthomonadales bacterium]